MSAIKKLVIFAFVLSITPLSSLKAAQLTSTWLGGTGTWNTPAKWNNGVPNNGANTFNVLIDNGNAAVSPVTLDISPTIDNLSISAGDSVAINNGFGLTVTGGAGAGTITNAGTINLNAGGFALLEPSNGTVTLTGGGTVTLSDSPNNFFYGVASSDRLLNVNNTIQGAGQIGNNFMALTNQGLIVANAVTNPLVLDLNDTDGVTNSGTLRAAGGGVLRLQNCPIANTGGTIEALNSSRIELTGTTISGGTLSTTGTGLIRVTGASTLDGNPSHTVTNSGAFEIAPSLTCTVLGTITNTGTITIKGASALLRPGGTVTLNGGGTVTLIDDVGNQIYGIAASDRLINVDNTIQGAGQIGENFLAITNQSLIVANAPTNPLILDPNDTDGVLNTGTLRATGGGVLRLQNGPFTNTGATIEALNNSRVELTNATIIGGTMATAGTGLIRVTGASTLDGSPSHTVTNFGAFEIPASLACTVTGTLNNTGTITVKGASALLRPGPGTVTLTGGGTVTLIDDVSNQIYGVAASDRLVNVNNTIQGAGQIGENFLAITNQSLIVANAPNNPLILDPNDTDGVLNMGTLRATAGGVLRLQNGAFTNTGATIEALNNSRVELTNATIIGGTMATAGTGLIRVTSLSYLDGSAHTVTNSGSFEIPLGLTTNIYGTISNTGTINMKGALLRPSGTVSLTGGGTVTMTDDLNNQFYGVAASDRLINVNNTIQGACQIGENFVAFTNQGTLIANGTHAIAIDVTDSGDFTNQGSLQATGTGGVNILTGPFTTSGTVTVSTGSQLTRTGNYTQTAGTTMANGTLHATGIVDIQGGVLKGTGNITSDVNNAGSVQPGNSAGLLTITGNYTQTSAAETSIEIGGLTVGTQYDRLAVTGVANLDGALRVSFINGFNPNIGDSFTVMTFASYTGTFSNFNVPCSLSGKAVQIDVGPTYVRVVISAAPIADINCDCAITIEDVQALTLALLDPATFATTYPTCGISHADLNGDGKIDGRDVSVFVHAFAP